MFKHGDNDDRTCKSGCSHCREYQETVSGFAEYFKIRNSIEKPVLDNFNLQLINNANKWRMDFIRSQTPPTPPLLPQKSTRLASEDNSPVIKSIDDAKTAIQKEDAASSDSRPRKERRCAILDRARMIAEAMVDAFKNENLMSILSDAGKE